MLTTEIARALEQHPEAVAAFLRAAEKASAHERYEEWLEGHSGPEPPFSI